MSEKTRLHEMGPGGSCICPKCETVSHHCSGERCQDQPCPNCGAKMLRVGSREHQLWLDKKSS